MVTSGVTLHQKSVLSPAVFESQLSTDSMVHTSIATGFKTSPASTENSQKVENSLDFSRKSPEPPVSARFKWSDESDSLPALPTVSPKYNRDLSGLRSASTNPFSSLKCRRRNPQNSYHRHSQAHRKYSYYSHYYPPTNPCHPPHSSQPSFALYLDCISKL